MLNYVQGPADGISTDNALVRWDGATGRLVQNSGTTLSDVGVLSTPNTGALDVNNTADPVTNFERVRIAPVTNIFVIATAAGGTGTERPLLMRAGAAGASIQLSNFGSAVYASTGATVTTGHTFQHATLTSTTLVQTGLSVASTVNQASGTGGYNGILVNPTLTAVGSAGARLFRAQVGGSDRWFIDNNGKTSRFGTITPAGTTGNQTINRPSGTVNVAAAGTGAVVTNNLVTANSQVRAFLRTNDGTAKSAVCVAAAGSFEIFLNAAATGEVSVGWLVEEIV